ncbi:hypothetical protein Oweho_3194 [Owenweeksia hongkongensis DSM 17368]|uniref:Phage protein, HK97 gp10 family n=1 Tax=Owenweeksia hongkongensis (strain DSM 17368 / CIP 108786 / JCM 12287 / NRRL B-23963 / UST20020801) TaxID=926562 RepID=G8R3Q8_OWEHD|nr:hypothetical protein [Owenweeksia hongkongensis]AEV34145.1 hypothetical protein Oweho_3194 [Owenweeksia hongkongensis DSM 17368]
MTARERFETRGDQSLLEKKYIAKVLSEEAEAIEEDQTRLIQRFYLIQSGDMETKRSHALSGQSDNYSGQVALSFLRYLRFHDMKKPKTTGSGRRRGKAYPIYNRIIFGHLNEISKKLSFGFTEEVRQQLAAELNIEISA